jgi:hypothetical protein
MSENERAGISEQNRYWAFSPPGLSAIEIANQIYKGKERVE